MKKWLIVIALLFAAFAGGYFAGRAKADPEVTVQRDTITFRDTVIQDRPVPVYVTQIRTDTVRLALIDSSTTTLIRDSATVRIPITRKVYQDSSYRAVISGYNANLDSIWVYGQTREIYITRTQKTQQKRWGFGAAAGPSVLFTPDGNVRGGFGITAGLTYRF